MSAAIADEPTAELDAKNRADVLAQIIGAGDRRRTVVIASHDESVISPCDEVVELIGGVVVSRP